jgi:hypothetical protein
VFGEKTSLLTFFPSNIPHDLQAETRDDRPAIKRLNQGRAFDLILSCFLLIQELNWI